MLIGLLLLLLVSRTLGLLFGRIKVSPIVGEVLGGLMLSPLLLNLLTDTPSLSMFSEFAIIVIMFRSGLHTDFSSFRKYKWTSIVIGATGVLVTFVLMFSLSLLAFSLSLETSLFMGAVLSNSAIEVSSALLNRTRFHKLRTFVVGASFIDDIMAVFILGVVLSFVHRTPDILLPVVGEVSGLTASFIHFLITSIEVLAFLLITFFILSWISHKVLDRFVSKGFGVVLSIAFIFAFGLGITAKWVGLHEVIGVYIAGLILSWWGITPHPMLKRGITSMKLKETFNRIMESLFSPIFFGFVGIMLGTALVEEGGSSWTYILLGVVAFTFFAFMGKIIGCGWGARLRKVAPGGALLIGVAMVGRGALEFILIESGLDEGILSPDLFSIVIMVTLLSIIVTPFLFRKVQKQRENELERSNL